eukprot:4203511-Prymnesium_polylepis.1
MVRRPLRRTRGGDWPTVRPAARHRAARMPVGQKGGASGVCGALRHGEALATTVSLQMTDALGRVGPPAWTTEPSEASVTIHCPVSCGPGRALRPFQRPPPNKTTCRYSLALVPRL